MDAREKALKEAASVLLAVSSNGGDLDSDDGNAGAGEGSHHDAAAIPTNSIAVSSSLPADSTANSISGNDVSPGGAADGTVVAESSKLRSRSDMLAMAKCRGEERKRANPTSMFEDNDARWKLSQIDDTFPATRFANN